MNSWPLVLAAAGTGLAGSLHCVAMCGALQRMAIRGIPIRTVGAAGTAPGTAPDTAAGSPPGAGRWLRFQLGRLLGYGMLGLVAGLLGEGLLAAASWQPVFESLWAALNALVLALGLAMLATGRQPGWIARFGSGLTGASTRPATPHGPVPARRPRLLLRGVAWAALPCGLIYAAVGLAVLAAEPIGAALTMLAFALGTSVGLAAFEAATGGFGPRLLPAALRRRMPARLDERLAFRLQGAVLAAAAGAGLGAALLGFAHPFC